MWEIRYQASILLKSILDRYRPITVQYRFKSNVSWVGAFGTSEFACGPLLGIVNSLRMRKLSSGPLLCIHTYCNNQ